MEIESARLGDGQAILWTKGLSLHAPRVYFGMTSRAK
jgi:hypothetical protein